MDITPELRKEVDVVFEKFDEFKKLFEGNPYSENKKEFFRISEDFRVFLATVPSAVSESISHSINYSKFKKFFRHQNDYFMRALETTQALDIIKQNVGVESSLLDLISEEYLKSRYQQKSYDLRLIENIDSAKEIVMVGCGPFPETILYLYENTNIPNIVGLDNNEEAIYISSYFVESLGFDRIHLFCENGNAYNYKDADIVYIAGFVPNKHEILEQIVKTGTNPDVQVIVDSATGMYELLYESINPGNVHPRLQIKSKDLSITKFSSQNMIKLMKYDI